MIETVTVRAELARSQLKGLREEDYYRVMGPAGPTYILKPHLRPEGISRQAYVTSGGRMYFSAEGNLTACLYGDRYTAGSLTAGEAALGMLAFESAAWGSARGALPEARNAEVVRMDASRSLVHGPQASTDELLSAYGVSQLASGTKAHPAQVIRSSGRTVAKGKRGSTRYERVYDKSSEARAAGKPCPSNVIRTEVELRPERVIYMTEAEELTGVADSELVAVADHLGRACAAFNQATVALLRHGMAELGEKDNPAEAMRLCGAASILAVSGLEGIVNEGGVSRATAYRMRARIEELMTAALGGSSESHLVQALRDASELLARDVLANDDGLVL